MSDFPAIGHVFDEPCDGGFHHAVFMAGGVAAAGVVWVRC